VIRATLRDSSVLGKLAAPDVAVVVGRTLSHLKLKISSHVNFVKSESKNPSIICFMGRIRRIDPSAKGTTISVTPAQKSLIRKLQTKRLEEGSQEPLLNEVVTEGLKVLFEREGFTSAELALAFPKREARGATIRVFPKSRGKN
jgi:hypothetical protein